MVESGDMELELFGFCELSEANAKGAQVVVSNVLSLFEDILTRR